MAYRPDNSTRRSAADSVVEAFKLQIAFIHYLFARGALDAIPDSTARLPEQANNCVRARLRSAR